MNQCECGRWTNYGKLCNFCSEAQVSSRVEAMDEHFLNENREIPTRKLDDDPLPLTFIMRRL